MYTVLDVQKRLKELGFDPGPLDGIRGRLTIGAVKRFQKSRRIGVDGIVGPITLGKLFGEKKKTPIGEPHTSTDYTPWMSIAYSKKGLHERHHNKSLFAWLKSDGSSVGDPAKIPWCGDFVETCIALSLPDEPLPKNPYLALNWKNWALEVTPQFGAVLSFWRGSPSSWKGHVGFYVGEDSTHFHVLGGNQSNAITVSRIAKTRLRKGGSRWPSTALKASGSATFKSGSGLTTTTNEA